MDTSKVFQIKRSPEAQEYYTPYYAVGYFCKGILPKDLILECIKRYHKPLSNDSLA